MEVLQTIENSVSANITVHSEDTSGDATNSVQEETFTLNVEGFSPRSIEEF